MPVEADSHAEVAGDLSEAAKTLGALLGPAGWLAEPSDTAPYTRDWLDRLVCHLWASPAQPFPKRSPRS